jgi:uncharacterized LabA/DUF88 family protein
LPANHLFIDGNYLRRAYEDTMRAVVPSATDRDIDFAALKTHADATKVYYYDAIGGTADQAADRAAFFKSLHSVPALHVKQGSVSARGNQKQVDVLLAVDCMRHAFHKQAERVTLLTGDLDFKPLVDALVDVGAYVTVMYEPKSGSSELCEAADEHKTLTIDDFWRLSTDSFKSKHAFPAPTAYGNSYFDLVRSGFCSGKLVWLFKMKTGSTHILSDRSEDAGPRTNPQDYIYGLHSTDLNSLLRYVELTRGAIAWDEAKEDAASVGDP